MPFSSLQLSILARFFVFFWNILVTLICYLTHILLLLRLRTVHVIFLPSLSWIQFQSRFPFVFQICFTALLFLRFLFVWVNFMWFRSLRNPIWTALSTVRFTTCNIIRTPRHFMFRLNLCLLCLLFEGFFLKIQLVASLPKKNCQFVIILLCRVFFILHIFFICLRKCLNFWLLSIELR